MSRAAAALRALQNFVEAYDKSIDDGATQMTEQWQGHAATAADAYFDRLVADLRRHGPTLNGLASELDTAVVGMWAAADAAKSAMELLTDRLIMAAVTAAAGLATAETVVGAVIGEAAAAYFLFEAGKEAIKFLKAVEHANEIVKSVVGVAGGFLGTLHEMGRLPLPAGAYDHPGATR